ncbi:Co2+/Mg2+ efflux protein ApaG [Teredinibacter haidensis]|uniref:Co2+/Mg2+ efflux protein ApaG n=1 Tax=Teredinibacter haidensis TaxID=2731755 RepID=UPI00094904FE|nr:Co2+/Mg2+ efflux protein ApaG [Teredinibacter haidensis]
MKVSVIAQYLDEQSQPNDSKYVFAYTISIENTGTEAAKLVSRYWHITDAHDRVQEVNGLGVIGEQPRLQAGETYTYTSGAVLETTTGTMRGHYVMVRDDGSRFEAEIPTFALIPPQALH